MWLTISAASDAVSTRWNTQDGADVSRPAPKACEVATGLPTFRPLLLQARRKLLCSGEQTLLFGSSETFGSATKRFAVCKIIPPRPKLRLRRLHICENHVNDSLGLARPRLNTCARRVRSAAKCGCEGTSSAG